MSSPGAFTKEELAMDSLSSFLGILQPRQKEG